jgi:hemerythrin superfamily protein
MTTTMPATDEVTGDVVSLVRHDHDAIRVCFRAFDQLPRDRWGDLFAALANLLRRHELAEDMVVYPALRSVPGSSEIAAGRRQERSLLQRHLMRLEQLETFVAGLELELGELEASFVDHIEADELNTLLIVAGSYSCDELIDLGELYQLVMGLPPVTAEAP